MKGEKKKQFLRLRCKIAIKNNEIVKQKEKLIEKKSLKILMYSNSEKNKIGVTRDRTKVLRIMRQL